VTDINNDNMKYTGKLIAGNFEDNTMTFEIEGEIILQAGEYTIIRNGIEKLVTDEDLTSISNQRKLLLSFMEYRDKIYWGENEHTKNEEIIDLWLKKSIVANEQV
jgi:hypothetical protein